MSPIVSGYNPEPLKDSAKESAERLSDALHNLVEKSKAEAEKIKADVAAQDHPPGLQVAKLFFDWVRLPALSAVNQDHCGAIMENYGWYCTRRKNHNGWHAAEVFESRADIESGSRERAICKAIWNEGFPEPDIESETPLSVGGYNTNAPVYCEGDSPFYDSLQPGCQGQVEGWYQGHRKNWYCNAHLPGLHVATGSRRRILGLKKR